MKDNFCDFVNNYNLEKPWCAFLGFSGPHEPWDAPLEFVDLYDPNSLDPPRSIKLGRLGIKQSLINKRLKRAEHNISNGMDYLSLKLNYAASVSFIDALIGDVINCLTINNSYKNTLIVFSSDHGEMNGDYGLLHKQCFLTVQLGFRLSLSHLVLISFRGLMIPLFVSLMDIASTIIDYSNVQNNDDHKIGFSNSLKKCVDFNASATKVVNHSSTSREYLMSQYGDELMLLDSGFKFMLNKNFACYGAFDRIEDPMEQNNLVSDDGTLPKKLKRYFRELKENGLHLFLQTQNFSSKHFCD